MPKTLMTTACNQHEALGSAFPAARKHDLAGRGVPDRAARGTGGKHAGTSPLRPALHARTRRAARAGGARCHRLSRAARLGARGPAGRGRLLHAERLSHHRPAARPVGPVRRPEPGRLLAPAGPAAAPRPVRDAGRGDRVGHGGEPVPAGQPARGGGRRRDVLQQLVLHLHAQFLLREVRPARPARPPLVAGRGGAVLPGLALAAAAGRVRGARPAAERGPLAGAAHPDPGRRVGGGDAHALPPRLRPDPDLRGLRHPGLRPADRGRAGHGLAQPPHRPDRAVVPGRAGRRGLRRAGRGRPDDLAGGPVLGVHLPGRAGAALGGHGRGGGRGRLSRHPGRRGPGLEAAALDRCPFLRDLPVALPRDHPDFAGQFDRGPAPGRPASGREYRDCRAVVAFRRRANPPWRAGTGLETDAFADGMAGPVGRGQQLGRGHRRGHGGRAGLCRAERRGAGAQRQQRGHGHPGRGLGPAAGRRPGPGRLGHERVQHERDQHERRPAPAGPAPAGPRTAGPARAVPRRAPGAPGPPARARPAARRPRRPRSAPPAGR